MSNSICECLSDICACLCGMLWTIASLTLGLVSGTCIGWIMTLLIFLITLVRTPLHMAKTLYVAATTDNCFESGILLDYVLRVMVVLLVPIVHLLWLWGITCFALVVGTLYYISRTTRTIYKHQFAKACSYGTATLQLDQNSLVGMYLQECYDFMAEAEAEDNPGLGINSSIVAALKLLCCFLPGIPLGALPFLPFTLGVVLITLYRLPINVYKSMKIAIITVTLKWDLKICALLMIPWAHLVFLVVAFLTALVGSFFAFLQSTIGSIFESQSPFVKWRDIALRLKDYYKAHERFVGEEFLGRYDHPTGIPLGWQGEIYGLAIQKILLWQWDFLVCCCVLMPFWALPVCFLGSVLIFAVKIVPGILSWWREQIKHISGESTAECLGCWAFYMVGLLGTPIAALVACVVAIFAGTLTSFHAIHVYRRYGCLAGFHDPFQRLRDIDCWDFFLLDGFRVLKCLPGYNPYKNDTHQQQRRARNANARRHSNNNSAQTKMSANAYWDRFATQCIQTTAGLLDKGWMTRDQVEAMDPSILSVIPAIAVLTILVDSVHDPEAKKTGDISWKVDGTICKEKDRPPLDNIGAMLWPKIVEVKRLLKAGRKNKDVAKETNIEIIMAMLCSSTDEPTDELEAFVNFIETEKKDTHHQATNNLIRSKLTELSLMILQVKPFRDRMTLIFGHKYTVGDEEEGGVSGEADKKNEPNESPKRGWWSSWWSSRATTEATNP